LYDYLWSQVKREKGAVDQKERIVKAAMSKGALSDSLIAKIAKSSPKRIKRTVVAGINSEMTMQNRRLRKAEASPSDTTPAYIDSIKQRVAKLESRAMLFVGCDDYSVVESLIDCLSRDNLPWLMPAASGHYYLIQRLNRLIDDESKN
jgi:hypothetical protein